MSARLEYEAFLERRKEYQKRHLAKYWNNQEARYIKPFQVFGNLYYVGDSWVCTHLVDTGDGLLLFDAGNCGATAMLIQAIWEMGFRPDDVKWIVLSHGHVDHIGAVNFFKRMFGTKVYMGAPDAAMFREKPEWAFLQDSSDFMDELFEVDVEIQDGDVMKFGNIEVRFYLTPGHTEGTISCFFHVTDGVEQKRIGYFGGFGFNTLQKDVLIEMGDAEFSMRKRMEESLERMMDELVDIFMPNHAGNVDLVNKRQYMLEHPGENPFLDKDAWKKFLGMKLEAVRALMDDSPKK